MSHRRFKCRVFSSRQRNPLPIIKNGPLYFSYSLFSASDYVDSSPSAIVTAHYIYPYSHSRFMYVLQSGNINSHEKEKAKALRGFNLFHTLSHIVGMRHFYRYSPPTSSLSILSGISSCHRSKIILSLRVRSTLTGT